MNFYFVGKNAYFCTIFNECSTKATLLAIRWLKTQSQRLIDMRAIDKFLKKVVLGSDRRVRDFCEKKPSRLRFYENKYMPLQLSFFRWHNYAIGDHVLGALRKSTEKYIRINLTPEQMADVKYTSKLRDDIIKCRLIYKTHPTEYFLYGYEHLDYWQRKEYLSDSDRWRILHERFGKKVHREHADKWFFYHLAQPYFHREACKVGEEAKKEDFLRFVSRHHDFFVKPLDGCFGRNAYRLEADSEEKAEEIYQKLVSNGVWIVEELITQSEEFAAWNASSVNTVRIASFLTAEGVHHNIVPFFRAGRVGSVVDNALSGGIIAGVDEKTGVLCSDGMDEEGRHFNAHPDSGIVFEGWQVPDWQELCRLTEEIHRSLPPYHRYIAFDFAHTAKGWVLVEGNWGQLIFNQSGCHRGVRKEFLNYIK